MFRNQKSQLPEWTCTRSSRHVLTYSQWKVPSQALTLVHLKVSIFLKTTWRASAVTSAVLCLCTITLKFQKKSKNYTQINKINKMNCLISKLLLQKTWWKTKSWWRFLKETRQVGQIVNHLRTTCRLRRWPRWCPLLEKLKYRSLKKLLN